MLIPTITQALYLHIWKKGNISAANDKQSWHFDRNSDRCIDSRLEHSKECLREAVKGYLLAENEEQRKEALKVLGRGLHPLQDYYAHMDWGTENYDDFISDVHPSEYDDPTIDFGPSGNIISSEESNRIINTENATRQYLRDFLRQTGQL